MVAGSVGGGFVGDSFGGCLVGALDVGLELWEFDPPLSAAADAYCTKVSGADQCVGLGAADGEHFLDMLEGYEALRWRGGRELIGAGVDCGPEVVEEFAGGLGARLGKRCAVVMGLLEVWAAATILDSGNDGSLCCRAR